MYTIRLSHPNIVETGLFFTDYLHAQLYAEYLKAIYPTDILSIIQVTPNKQPPQHYLDGKQCYLITYHRERKVVEATIKLNYSDWYKQCEVNYVSQLGMRVFVYTFALNEQEAEQSVVQRIERILDELT